MIRLMIRRLSRFFLPQPLLLFVALAFCCSLPGIGMMSVQADDPRIRVGVLKFGTVMWELDVIETHGLDRKEGVDLEVVELGSKQATSVALQGDGTDVIVTDWIWVSRRRAEGRDYAFVPYSLAVGGLMVDPKAQISALTDLAGKKVGVAGGPVDKSWLLVQALAKSRGLDLAAMVEPTFGAPPLLNKLASKGDLPAVLNFWHYNARLRAKGFEELISVSEILPELGIDRPVPLLGWVFSRRFAEENKDALTAFLRASYAAKRLMLDSDAEWERLAPKMKAPDATTARTLRDAWRAGVPHRFDAEDRQAAARTFDVLAREGGEKLVGARDTLSPGTFWEGFELPRRMN